MKLNLKEDEMETIQINNVAQPYNYSATQLNLTNIKTFTTTKHIINNNEICFLIDIELYIYDICAEVFLLFV